MYSELAMKLVSRKGGQIDKRTNGGKKCVVTD